MLDAGVVAVAAGGTRDRTRPPSAARIGVPVGAAMSMPGWQDSQERRSQNGDVIGRR